MSSPPTIPTPAQGPHSSPQVTVVLTVTILFFFFVGFILVYICRCVAENSRVSTAGPNLRATAIQTSALPGLDVNIIETFPKFKYSAVKDLKKGEIGLECAICLSEFLDEDFLRLLSICCHVFHQECVNLWLESHKTCPVCRTALDSPPDEKSTPKGFDDYIRSPANEFHHDHKESQGLVIMTAKDDDHEENEIPITQTARSSSVRIFITDDETQNTRQRNLKVINKRRAIAEKISRCSSTGHSIFRNKVEGVEKYTRRLPDNVREQIIKGHHQYVKSCTEFGEYSTNSFNRGNRFGEMSGTSSGNVDDKV